MPRKEKFSAFAKFVQHWLKMFNIKKKKITLLYARINDFVMRWYVPWI